MNSKNRHLAYFLITFAIVAALWVAVARGDEEPTSCLMAPCFSDESRNYDYRLVPFDKDGNILVDCSCNPNAPKRQFKLGVYYYKCTGKIAPELVQPITCKQFNFEPKESK